MNKITPKIFNDFSKSQLPQAYELGFRAETIGYGHAIVRMPFNDISIRPGGTISGPAMMGLADFSMYAALMGAIGQVELAVTTSLNINFLRLPKKSDIIAECQIMKLGKRLAVLQVTLLSDGDTEPIAHATGTYSIPPKKVDKKIL
ncbi:MAG: thioesterase [Rhodospirillaceae bacterium]|nr:thioesterase [Rhodospirillaceae bacterium]|tara:strand:+ start:69 stop:506 length:438 start_codon:yes stop_codon:yes gene_type:complete